METTKFSRCKETTGTLNFQLSVSVGSELADSLRELNQSMRKVIQVAPSEEELEQEARVLEELKKALGASKGERCFFLGPRIQLP